MLDAVDISTAFSRSSTCKSIGSEQAKETEPLTAKWVPQDCRVNREPSFYGDNRHQSLAINTISSRVEKAPKTVININSHSIAKAGM